MAYSPASPSPRAHASERHAAAPGIAQDRRSRFVRLHEHPWALAGVAVAIGAAVLVVVTAIAGWSAVGHAFADLHPGWIALGVGGQLVAMGAYVVAFRSVSAVGRPTAVPLRVAGLVVVAGFGPHAVGGGFALDERVLRALRGDPRCATVRVLGLGALEWALLAPAARIAAIVLLIAGSDVQTALLWSWALAVPAGFGLGLWAAAPSRRERVPEKGTVRNGLRRALEGVGVLRTLAAHPRRHVGAPLGMAGYWIADIATLYAAARLFGVSLGLGHLILAYATGYAATRRTLPLGGVGATEALMSASLVWIGLPLAQAVPIVAAYRLANVVMPLIPAGHAQRRVLSLMR